MNLIPIERNEQRIILTSQLAEGYGTTAENITRNFNRNRDRYQEGKHYFALTGNDKMQFLNLGQFDLGLRNAPVLYLWTEKGALLHAKSLNTDQAWETYDMLVETYFKTNVHPKCIEDVLIEAVLGLKETRLRLEAQQKELDAANKRIDSAAKQMNEIREIVVYNPETWRKDTGHMIAKIARSKGGDHYQQAVRTEIYDAFERRAHVDLSIRLENMKKRLISEGASKTKVRETNKLDVIEFGKDAPKMIEIYCIIVKEFAIKHGVELSGINQ